jgi:uncharacterized metal-binding protein
MEACTGTASPRTIAALGVDKLSYEISSLLESKFLFGGDCLSGPGTAAKELFRCGGRVRVLSIDGCARRGVLRRRGGSWGGRCAGGDAVPAES